MGLTFGQVEDVLATTFYVKNEARKKFQARLKQWQKMGFPAGVNVGRGAKASYGAGQLYQLAFFMRLLWLGLTPERAQIIIQSTWPALKKQIAVETARIARAEPEIGYAIFQIQGLTELTDPEADHLHVHFFRATDSLFVEAFDGDPEEYPPDYRESFEHFQFTFKNTLAQGVVVIEISSLLMRVWGSMILHGQQPAQMADEVREWWLEAQDEDGAESPGPEEGKELVRQITDNLSEAKIWDYYSPVELARHSIGLPMEELQNVSNPEA